MRWTGHGPRGGWAATLSVFLEDEFAFFVVIFIFASSAVLASLAFVLWLCLLGCLREPGGVPWRGSSRRQAV